MDSNGAPGESHPAVPLARSAFWRRMPHTHIYTARDDWNAFAGLGLEACKEQGPGILAYRPDSSMRTIRTASPLWTGCQRGGGAFGRNGEIRSDDDRKGRRLPGIAKIDTTELQGLKNVKRCT